MPLIAAGIGAAASIGGAYLGNRAKKKADEDALKAQGKLGKTGRAASRHAINVLEGQLLRRDPKESVMKFGGVTQDALRQMRGMGSNPTLKKSEGYVGDVLGGKYLNNMPEIKGMAEGEKFAAQAMGGQYDFAEDPRLATSGNYIQDVLTGKYLDAGNPHQQAVIDSLSRNYGAQVGTANANAALSGRSGSGASAYAQTDVAGALARELGKLQFDQYNLERGNMQAATGMATDLNAARLGVNQANVGNRFAGADMGQEFSGMRLDRYNTERANQQAALGMAPAVYDMRDKAIGSRLTAGQMADQNALDRRNARSANAEKLLGLVGAGG